MMANRMNLKKGLQWANGSATASGATTVTLTLPGGAVGKPVKLKAVGTVAAQITLTYGNQQQVTALVQPNGPAAEEPIPDQAFNNPVASVVVTATLSAAGTVYISAGFA